MWDASRLFRLEGSYVKPDESLAARARDDLVSAGYPLVLTEVLLTSGKRLAQEAVGTELLSRSWTGLAGLDSPL